MRKYKYKKGDIVWCSYNTSHQGCLLTNERCEVIKSNRSPASIYFFGVSYNLKVLDKEHAYYGKDFLYMTENSLGSGITNLPHPNGYYAFIREEKLEGLLND